MVLVVGVAAVVVLVLGGGGAFAYVALRDTGPLPTPAAGPTAGSGPPGTTQSNPSPSPSFDADEIRNIETDSKPLTLTEAFPDETLTVGGTTFERVATDLAKNCTAAGQQGFDRALRAADCRRVLRATFVSENGKYAVTSGIAVLPTSAKANQLDSAARARDNIWFAALPGPGAEQIARSGGYSFLDPVGHYVVFSFATYANRIRPPTNAEELEELGAVMRNYAVQPIVERGTVRSR